MSKTIELVSNGLNGFELNRSITRDEMWDVAKEEGFEGSRASFFRLLDGKIKSANGYIIMKQVLIPKSEREASTVNKVAAIKTLKANAHIVKGNTETYGTITVNCGRVQINPLPNGKYTVLVLPKKGFTVQQIKNMVGVGKERAQYVNVGRISAKEVSSLLERLK